MKKVIMRIHPFVRNQILNVYENGNPIDTMSIPTENVVENIFVLKEKYPDIGELDIAGPKQYSKNIQKKLINNTKYSNDFKVIIL